jgi:hypothetical protein
MIKYAYFVSKLKICVHKRKPFLCFWLFYLNLFLYIKSFNKVFLK